jgi:hypothetical protein
VPRLEDAVEDSHGPRVPRSSVKVVANTLTEHREARGRRAAVRSGAGLALIVVALGAANFFLVRQPVGAALAADTAAARLRLTARFQWYLDPTTLVLDLREADPAAPEQTFHGLLVAADAMRREEGTFARVVLARAGRPVYVLSGDDFRALGSAFASARNPLDVLRTIPPMLRGTLGSDAFGLLGAALADPVGERDLDVVARRWLGGMAQ